LPAVSLVAVKVIDRNNRFNSTSDVIAALDWLAAQHPDIDAVNLSLGTDALFAGDCDNSAAWAQALAVAVANLNALGAVVTASSGNQGNLAGMSAPACIRNVVSNAATWDFSGGATTFLGCTESTTAPGQPTCFSNRSATTDLFAAGAFVRAPGFNGGTSNFGGTSQAAPMAAACAVALKQAAPASTVSQRMIAMTLSPTRIQDTAAGRSYPFLDCRDAMKLLNPAMFDPIPVDGARPRVRPRG
jgi:Subtilase family